MKSQIDNIHRVFLAFPTSISIMTGLNGKDLMMRLRRIYSTVFFINLIILHIAACMPVKPPAYCLQSNWKNLGYQEGAQGHQTDFERHQRTCAYAEQPIDITNHFKDYQLGYDEGRQYYCTTDDSFYWRSKGYEDGQRGMSVEQFYTYDKAKICAGFEFSADLTSYQAGYQEGIAVYCRPERGFEMGEQFEAYQSGQCPSHLEQTFVKNYLRGLKQSRHSTALKLQDKQAALCQLKTVETSPCLESEQVRHDLQYKIDQLTADIHQLSEQHKKADRLFERTLALQFGDLFDAFYEGEKVNTATCQIVLPSVCPPKKIPKSRFQQQP